jgi:hypothetical protein
MPPSDAYVLVVDPFRCAVWSTAAHGVIYASGKSPHPVVRMDPIDPDAFNLAGALDLAIADNGATLAAIFDDGVVALATIAAPVSNAEAANGEDQPTDQATDQATDQSTAPPLTFGSHAVVLEPTGACTVAHRYTRVVAIAESRFAAVTVDGAVCTLSAIGPDSMEETAWDLKDTAIDTVVAIAAPRGPGAGCPVAVIGRSAAVAGTVVLTASDDAVRQLRVATATEMADSPLLSSAGDPDSRTAGSSNSGFGTASATKALDALHRAAQCLPHRTVLSAAGNPPVVTGGTYLRGDLGFLPDACAIADALLEGLGDASAVLDLPWPPSAIAAALSAAWSAHADRPADQSAPPTRAGAERHYTPAPMTSRDAAALRVCFEPVRAALGAPRVDTTKVDNDNNNDNGNDNGNDNDNSDATTTTTDTTTSVAQLAELVAATSNAERDLDPATWRWVRAVGPEAALGALVASGRYTDATALAHCVAQRTDRWAHVATVCIVHAVAGSTAAALAEFAASDVCLWIATIAAQRADRAGVDAAREAMLSAMDFTSLIDAPHAVWQIDAALHGLSAGAAGMGAVIYYILYYFILF